MSKREVYEQKTEEILLPILEKHGFELWDVEYVKEGSNWYLRAYIDKPGGIMVDDCEVVSRELSDILDEKDFIDEAYILFARVKEMTAKLAEVENGIYRLAVAIKKTQKRANALKNILIPKFMNISKYISDSLEEKEREEFSRLKVIKTQKSRKTENH